MKRIVAFVLLAGITASSQADLMCLDRETFVEDGWKQPDVQDAMDDYLRDHRMRVNWMQEPRPPNAIGRDYYEWLWIDEFGAAMKAEIVERFCGTSPVEAEE